jgi:hypothetical protein|tara:strand:- start:905 stop:1237 length:333 start_codon:yes stop_codon:yes gene_type:complete
VEHETLAVERNSQAPESGIEDVSTRQNQTKNAANVVFLPFSESLLNASTTQRHRHLPCWQRQAVSQPRTTNYPSFDSAMASSAPVLVPLDRSAMSLCVKRDGRWERIIQP